jgi:hypothetical protein
LAVALVRFPESMGVVLLTVNNQVAAPAISACVVVKEAKKRMGRPDWPARELL